MLWWYWAIVINTYEAWHHYGFKAALYTHFIVMYFFWWLIMILLVILATAIITLNERKTMAAMQSRRGPIKSGSLGLLQPIADAVKLLLKEYVKPRQSYNSLYAGAAVLSFIVAAFFWNLPALSFENVSISNEWTIFLSFLVSFAHIYTIIFAGWSSNSKYAFLGALRTAAQLIAYDIVIALVYLNIFIFTKEASFENFAEMQRAMIPLSIFMPFQFMVFFIATLAEASRHPYDLPEAEAELVAGYNVEYSGIRFAMFFLAEYSTAIFSAVTIHTLFLSGSIFDIWWIEFISWIVIVSLLTYLIIKARALLPRFRYDQLMELGWKVLIPIECVSLFYNIFIIGGLV